MIERHTMLFTTDCNEKMTCRRHLKDVWFQSVDKSALCSISNTCVFDHITRKRPMPPPNVIADIQPCACMLSHCSLTDRSFPTKGLVRGKWCLGAKCKLEMPR
jgi:hypothetical protein